MDEDLGSSYITIEDEDGNEFELEQLATMEFNGNEYSAFLPADMRTTRITAISSSGSKRKTAKSCSAPLTTKRSS